MFKFSQPVVSSDAELIRSARQGDLRAFGALVERYQEKVVNVIYRLCGDPELAQDVSQEAFIRAWQKLPQYDIQRPFQNWLLRIAANIAISHLRQVKPTVDIEKVQLESMHENPDILVEEKQRAAWVRQAILDLPVASRSVLVLREYEGFSYKEIADALQIPIGTVMSRLNYARTQLHQSLKHLMEAK